MIYIAFLRGINVSGQKSIKMADLKHGFEELGFVSVTTYIQSGNVVFESEFGNARELEGVISKKIMEKFGFDVATVVLERSDLKKLIARNPFKEEPTANPKLLYVSLLSQAPKEIDPAVLEDLNATPEEFKIIGKYFYIYATNGYGKAKLNNAYIEEKLNLIATNRNWNTLNKLADIVRKR